MTDKKPQNRRVITRKGAKSKQAAGKFAFSHEMIPVFSSNGTKQSAFITAYREKAWAAFENLNIPTTTEEPWRRTDIRKMPAGIFALDTAKKSSASPSIPADLINPEEYGGNIILSPNGSDVSLSEDIAAQGVIFTDLATAYAHHAEILEKVLGQLVNVQNGKFAAMAGAFANQGALLYIPKGVHIERPLRSLMWAPGVGRAHFSHILVWVEDQASATYVHESVSPTEDGQAMHAGIVEIHVGKAANLRFIELQSWGEHVWNFTHKRARLERDAKLDWILGALGSRLTKDFSEIDMVGEGSEGRMSGFYFTDGTQHFDYDTQQNHLAPHTSSDLLFKGALSGNSRSVWQGMIYVAPDAQKTDGYQLNPNLLLSENARADSIPGLEILADDVRCTHGATVGNVDPEELFYLRSRGISLKESERLIVEGFFDPVIQRVPVKELRERFAKAVVDKLQ
jgi:Fe-S cluster assembly protein SufD